MTVTMRPRRALGVVLIFLGIVLVLTQPDDRIGGLTFLGVVAAAVGVFLATMRDAYIAHAFVQLGPHTWLHRGSCSCGRGTQYLRSRRQLLAFARGDELLPVRHVRR